MRKSYVATSDAGKSIRGSPNPAKPELNIDDWIVFRPRRRRRSRNRKNRVGEARCKRFEDEDEDDISAR